MSGSRMLRVWSVVFPFLAGFSLGEDFSHKVLEKGMRSFQEQAPPNPVSRFDKWVQEEPYKTVYKRSAALKDIRGILPGLLQSKAGSRIEDFGKLFSGLQTLLDFSREVSETTLLNHLATELGFVAVTNKDGKAVYEQYYGDPPKRMLQLVRSHGDWKLLEQLVLQYPFSESGLEALEIFATHYLDRGQYDLASFYFNLLHERQRKLGRVLSPRVQYQMLLSKIRANGGKDWRTQFEAFSQENPNGIAVGGVQISLTHLDKSIGDSIAKMSSDRVMPVISVFSSQHWLPILGASALRKKTHDRNEDIYLTAYKANGEGNRFFRGEPFLEVHSKKFLTPLMKKGHFEFVKINPGTFVMGSPLTEKNRNYNEDPHQVRITKPFEIQTTVVTQALWEFVMKNNPSSIKQPDLPSTDVSWNAITRKGGFLDKLNKLTDYSSYKYRLPTEAEWEFAARGGTQTAYSFGEDPKELGKFAWFGGNSGDRVQIVRTRLPNPYGLYDMHGNVWQWVQDRYTNTLMDGVDPIGAFHELTRVYRGGSAASYAKYLRSASRANGHTEDGFPFLGFRLVRVRR